MKKLCYYLDMSDECRKVLTELIESIPCYIWEEDEVITIECEETDVAFIEKILAPFV